MLKRFARVLGATIALFSVLATTGFFGWPHAHAAALTAVSDVLSSIKPGAANHTIRFTTPSGLNGTTKTIKITFPTGFVMGSVDYTDIDLSYGATTGAEAEATLAAAPGAGSWGAAISGQDLTFTYPTSGGTAIAAGDKVIVEVGTNASAGATGDQQVTNPAAGNDKKMTIVTTSNGSTVVDSGALAISIIANDQVSVTATVDPTLSFSIDDVAIGFGTFTPATLRYATADAAGSASEPATGDPVQLQASTNASSGVSITIQDEGSGSAAGLYASAINNLIAAAISTAVDDNLTTVAAYGVYAKGATNLTIAEGFDHDGNADTAITRSAQTIASSSAPVNAAVVDVALLANVIATTKAGAYADTLTIICTGNF